MICRSKQTNHFNSETKNNSSSSSNNNDNTEDFPCHIKNQGFLSKQSKLKSDGAQRYLDSEIINGIGGFLSHIQRERRNLGCAIEIKCWCTENQERYPIDNLKKMHLEENSMFKFQRRPTWLERLVRAKENYFLVYISNLLNTHF